MELAESKGIEPSSVRMARISSPVAHHCALLSIRTFLKNPRLHNSLIDIAIYAIEVLYVAVAGLEPA